MEAQNTPSASPDNGFLNKRGRSPLGGVILVLIGLVLLAKQLDLGLPYWLFSWPMIPIAVGLYIGAKQNFRFGGWIVPIIIGLAFLLEKGLWGYDMRHYFWPTVIILIGLYMIIRPRQRGWDGEVFTGPTDSSDADFVNSSIVLGGIKKNVISKNFKGGRIENVFGGTDLNMMQADFKGTIVMDFNIAFGGCKIVMPAQWNVRNEITAILGGIDDKRPPVADVDQSKTLILRGTVMFGGVDIKSY